MSKAIRLIPAIILGLLLVLAIQLALLLSSPANASPFAQLTTQTPFWRYLDTAGNSTGSKMATGTYAAATSFYLQPPTGAVYDISRLIVSVEDSAVITSNLYGAVASPTTGVVIRRVSGSTIITLTDGISLTSNIAWRRFCEVTQTNNAGTTNQLQAICKFDGALLRLSGDQSEKLEVVLNGDFSGLEGHYFVAEGFKE
jgi:hypothetical protein